MDDAFRSFLLPGERIAWTGRPGGGVIFTAMDVFVIPFTLLWCGLAFPILWLAPQTGPGGPAPLWFSAVFVAVGFYMLVGRFIVDWWLRRGLSYAVTDRRILIARSAPFRKFTALNLASLSDVSLKERASGRGTIRFGASAPFWVNRRGNWGVLSPALDPVPQFIVIEDVRRVFDLVQRGAQRATGGSSG